MGYYGADVSGPVFKKIAQKIYTDTPTMDFIDNINQTSEAVENQFQTYYKLAQAATNIMPDLKGMPAMDAIAILENMGLKVTTIGDGIVEKQSLVSGQKVKPNTNIVLELS